jgi:hypothetical protein
MVLIGIDQGTVVLCVNIDPPQLELAQQMYPDWILQEQVADENIGWTFDGVTFIPPQG